MRLPRMRFTVRQTMISVVLVAVTLVGFCGWRCRVYYLRRAADYRALAHECSGAADFREMMRDDAEEEVCRGDLSWTGPAAQQRREAELARRWSTYWNQLRRKYEAAATRPSLPVEPDPPLRLPVSSVPKSIKDQTAPAR
jgi:hypothetical protein